MVLYLYQFFATLIPLNIPTPTPPATAAPKEVASSRYRGRKISTPRT